MPDRAFRGSAVELAVYDLSPANDCLATIGWGLHHSGVRVGGREYTYSDDGVFSHSEGEVGDENVRLRAVIPLGELSIDNRAVDGAVTEGAIVDKRRGVPRVTPHTEGASLLCLRSRVAVAGGRRR